MKQANGVSDLTELEGGHVFRLWLVHDIFRKLHREKQRFEKAGLDNAGRNDQVDAAINFAITAWHMTDWVWERQKDALGKCLDVNSLHEFQDKIRQQCPDLAVCDVIANAAKHGGTAHMREDRPEIETVLIADPVTEGAPGVELIAVVAGPEWSLEIRVNGKPEDLQAVFNRVFLAFGTNSFSDIASPRRHRNAEISLRNSKPSPDHLSVSALGQKRT